MKNVAIYTTPTCSYCNMAKAFFQEKGIKYEEYNVATDQKRREEMIEKSGQMGVPVISISGDDLPEEQIIIGFDRRGLANAFGL